MRYKILFVLSLLALPAVSLAVSGACSSHLGVNCSAGADFDGSVICFDGWRQSTVAYSSADECKNTTTETTCNVSALNALLNSSGLAGSSEANQRMSDCEAKNVKANTPPIPTYTYTPVVSVPVETQQEKQSRLDKQCHDRYSDYNSHAENGYCVCNTGYVLYSNTGVCESIKRVEVITPVVVPAPAPVEQVAVAETPKVISTPKISKKTVASVKIEKSEKPTGVAVASTPKVEQTKLETPQQPIPKKTFWQKLKGFLGF